MIDRFLFEKRVTNDLELALDAYSARQKAITDNIANVNTPGYKAKKVTFEEEYSKALEAAEIKGKLTHEKHMDIGRDDTDNLTPEYPLQKDRENDSGVNNVDIEYEMVEMAKNNIRYEMGTLLISKKFAGIRDAIKGR